MKISNEILNILDSCRIENGVVFLPNVQLDRKIYIKVNKCLESIGGSWNRKVKGHVFNDDPAELFDNLMLTGELTNWKKEFQFFETPNDIVVDMIDLAEIQDNYMVLEPSAGLGAIADQISIKSRIVCCELNSINKSKLKEKGYRVAADDFLQYNQDGFDRIVMNPPFSLQQDISHILHAWDLLRADGILVSIVSESPFFRENKKSVEFRNWLEENNAEIIKLDVGAFKESGTMVKTRMIKVVKNSLN